MVFQHYLHRPEEATSPVVTAEGFFRTGDGCGRVPTHPDSGVETRCRRHSTSNACPLYISRYAMAEVSMIGLPDDETWGERVSGHGVSEATTTTARDGNLQYTSNTSLAQYQIPSERTTSSSILHCYEMKSIQRNVIESMRRKK